MQERRLSYEKCGSVARYADEASVESWVERAESIPCIQFRRELQGVEETQICARRIRRLVPDALRWELGEPQSLSG
jgi:hypothetical protein